MNLENINVMQEISKWKAKAPLWTNWLAIDGYGRVTAFYEKPFLGDDVWYLRELTGRFDFLGFTELDELKNDWEDSLIKITQSEKQLMHAFRKIIEDLKQ